MSEPECGQNAPVDHELKCWPEPFWEIARGLKTAEFRRADRAFALNDLLHLREWNPEPETYTGRSVYVRITAISRGPDWCIPEGYAMLSILLV